MKTIGIICECNPFHGGHEYLIKCARESGADAIVCVMSGNFVQRGEAAVLSPHARAEILVRSGADAVVELPFPYAASSAEFFGRAGVEILSRLGIDEVWFGSETGDLSILSRYAEVADSEEFQAAYTAATEGESGTASAYFSLLSKMANDENAACAPNDILAISYLRAIRKLGANIRPVTIKREGSAYAEKELVVGAFPSAIALRRAWEENEIESIMPYLPGVCGEVSRREGKAKRAPATLKNAESLVLGMLALTPQKELESYAGLGGGLAGRLHNAASKATTLDEFFELCATKKYPDARIRRGVLHALLRVTEEDLRAPVSYVRLLAANETGRAFLASARKTSDMPVVTRQTDLPETPEAARQFELEMASAALYSKCLPKPIAADEQLRRPPVILETKK
jgi:predicted nucleotidyltransferase